MRLTNTVSLMNTNKRDPGEWVRSCILKGKLRHDMSKGLKVYVINVCLHQNQYNDKWL